MFHFSFHLVYRLLARSLGDPFGGVSYWKLILRSLYCIRLYSYEEKCGLGLELYRTTQMLTWIGYDRIELK